MLSRSHIPARATQHVLARIDFRCASADIASEVATQVSSDKDLKDCAAEISMAGNCSASVRQAGVADLKGLHLGTWIHNLTPYMSMLAHMDQSYWTTGLSIIRAKSPL